MTCNTGKYFSEQLFVLVTLNGPISIWVGTVSKEAHDKWMYSQSALLIQYPRGFIIKGDRATNTVMVNIGPPYIGDTPQTEIALFPISVEVIGTVIEDAASNSKSCSGNNGLFQNYLDAVNKWRAAMANIVMAGPGDIPKNVMQFPPRT